MTRTNSKSIFSILLVIAFILLALLGFAIYRIRSENKETSRLLNLSDQRAQEQVAVQAIRSLQNAASSEIAAFQSLPLTDERLVPVIESIEAAGRSLGLEIEIVSVDNALKGSSTGPQKIVIVIDASGSWKGNFSFLRAMEELPNRVTFQSINLSQGKDAWHSRITLELLSFN